MASCKRSSPAIPLFLCLLIAGCGAYPLRDGQPATRTQSRTAPPPDAVPRPEARSRYGNGPYYRVYGRTYKVLESSYGYRERGVASWYGRKFHGRKTSNQEPYDMYAMTAAHKTLPLPTYVRVTNLKNNRSVVVRVNDRGPFVDNRLIDLSYAAASRLDLVRDGTGLVEVTALSFDEPPAEETVTASAAESGSAPVGETIVAEETPESSPPATIFVQVGAFGEAENARRRYAMLRDSGIVSAFVHEDMSTSPTLYRVRIGPIADVVQYDSLVEELQRLGITDTHLVTE